MKILIISKCPTHPINAGNRWAVLSQANTLDKLGNEVHFLYVEELPMRKEKETFEESLVETARYWGKRFHHYRISTFQKLIFNLRKKWDEQFCSNYYSVDETFPWGLISYVNQLDKEYHFDVCIVNYVYLSKLLTKIKIPKTAIHTHDCLAYKDLKVEEPCRTLTAHQEAIGLQRCQHIFALQDDEASYFRLLSPKSKVYTIYSKYDYRHQPIVGNKNMVFLSGNNSYNQNGIKWFIREVLPLIRKRFPDAQLLVGGSICKVLKNLSENEGVQSLGYVDYPDDFYAMADVAINPVYQGTGLKIKTFESISYDKVTMVHPHSMEGVFDKDHSSLFSSANPQEWLDFLVKLWETKEISIEDIKKSNKKYMEKMNEFIVSEYERFLND